MPNTQKSLIPLTCDQVLIFVDFQLNPAEALRGLCVDILDMRHLFEATVHLERRQKEQEYIYALSCF